MIDNIQMTSVLFFALFSFIAAAPVEIHKELPWWAKPLSIIVAGFSFAIFFIAAVVRIWS